MNAIETHALSKSYGSKRALDALDLSVPQGELLALLGVNGAGKTTTIKLLSGLIPPTSGTATICGHDIVTDTRAAKSVLGTSPQETAIAPNLTVRENLELIAGIYGATSQDAKAHAQAMIARFAMEEIANSRAKKLSGGWQRRLSIAMALISEPKVLFLDEPTLGLDVLARRALWETVRSLKGHITIILTTHYLEEVEALSDRVGILAGGKLIALGTAADICKQTGKESLEDAFISLAGGSMQ